MSEGTSGDSQAGVWVRRPLWLVILIVVGLALIAWLSNAFLVSHSDLAEPIRIEIRGLGTKNISTLADSLEIYIPKRWLDRGEGIDVAIGDRLFAFSREEVLRQWTLAPADYESVWSDLRDWTTRPGDAVEVGEAACRLSAPPQVSAERTHIPYRRVGVNYPGDVAVMWGAAPWRFFALLGTAAAAMVLVRLCPLRRAESWLRVILVPPTAAEPPRPAVAPAGGRKWLALGAAVVVAGIVAVEACQPYYFTQDDNFVSLLPIVLQGCRSAFNGVFPEWNPYQFLGMPTSGSGCWALLYPPTYLCYAVAAYVLHNEYLTIEVFAIFHLLACYATTYWAMRKVGVRPSLAAMGGVCVALSGFSLIAGRSWFSTGPALVYTALLVVTLANLERGAGGWKWSVLTGLVIGLFYAVGFAQMWIYGMVFLALAGVLFLVTGRLRMRQALWILPAVLLGLALAAPLMVVQISWAPGMANPSGDSAGVEAGLLAMLLPYPLTHAMDPEQWAHEHRQFMTQFYYSGTLFCAATFLALAAMLGYRWSRRLAAANVWVMVAGASLLLALGTVGVVAPFVSRLPVVGFLNNNPFRVLPFFNLFAALGGGLVVERCLNRLNRQRLWELGLGGTVAALMLYHAFLARPAFWNYGDTSYPQLPASMDTLLRPADGKPPQRVIPFAPLRTPQKGYAISLEHNLATVYSIPSFDIYDGVVARKSQYTETLRRMRADPVATARAYGIRWVIIHRLAETTDLSGLSRLERHIRNGSLMPALKQASRPVLTIGDIEIRDLVQASPLAFNEAEPDQSLPLRFSGNGVDVNVSGMKDGGTVVVNVMNWPIWRASANGQPLATASDKWNRVRVTVPQGVDHIKLRYTRPWGRGLLVGAVLAAMGVAAAGILSRLAGSRARESN